MNFISFITNLKHCKELRLCIAPCLVILLPRSVPWSSKRSEASCFLPLAPLEQEVSEGNDPIRRWLPLAASRLRRREPRAFSSSCTDESTRAARLTGAFTQQHQAAPHDGQLHQESHQDLFSPPLATDKKFSRRPLLARASKRPLPRKSVALPQATAAPSPRR